jgi:hypothetical protein
MVMMMMMMMMMMVVVVVMMTVVMVSVHQIELGHTAYTLVPFRCAFTSRWMAAVALHLGNFKFRVWMHTK